MGGLVMTQAILYVVCGFSVGTISGLVGIGGGVIAIPALVLLFGMSQHEAQGTTLAMLVPPIGLLAAWTYYKDGYVNTTAAAYLCAGFFLGGLIGAKIATGVPNMLLQRIFGIGMLLISLRMIFSR
jgi:uncharacterized protein